VHGNPKRCYIPTRRNAKKRILTFGSIPIWVTSIRRRIDGECSGCEREADDGGVRDELESWI